MSGMAKGWHRLGAKQRGGTGWRGTAFLLAAIFAFTAPGIIVWKVLD
ncbi:MAG: hypothetical protein ABI240_12175 [Sphingomonas sp.]